MAIASTTKRATNWAAELDGYLLAGIGAMLLRQARIGQLPLYVHPRYSPLIVTTGVVMLLLGGFRLFQRTQAPEELQRRLPIYGLLLAPLLLGVLIPAKPAGSALIDAQQLNTVGRTYGREAAPISDDTARWNLLDWMYARYTLAPEQTDGKPVDVVGFVYRAPGQSGEHFSVVRYTLACCVADRRGVSLPVQSAGADGLRNDQWVRVTGNIVAQPGEGMAELTVVDAQVIPVEQPKEPYLYSYQ